MVISLDFSYKVPLLVSDTYTELNKSSSVFFFKLTYGGLSHHPLSLYGSHMGLFSSPLVFLKRGLGFYQMTSYMPGEKRSGGGYDQGSSRGGKGQGSLTTLISKVLINNTCSPSSAHCQVWDFLS